MWVQSIRTNLDTKRSFATRCFFGHDLTPFTICAFGKIDPKHIGIMLYFSNPGKDSTITLESGSVQFSPPLSYPWELILPCRSSGHHFC